MNAGVGPGVVSSVRNAAYGGSLFPTGSLPFRHCADDSAALAVLERRYARYTNYLREAVEGASFVELQHAVAALCHAGVVGSDDQGTCRRRGTVVIL